MGELTIAKSAGFCFGVTRAAPWLSDPLPFPLFPLLDAVSVCGSVEESFPPLLFPLLLLLLPTAAFSGTSVTATAALLFCSSSVFAETVTLSPSLSESCTWKVISKSVPFVSSSVEDANTNTASPSDLLPLTGSLMSVRTPFIMEPASVDTSFSCELSYVTRILPFVIFVSPLISRVTFHASLPA